MTRPGRPKTKAGEAYTPLAMWTREVLRHMRDTHGWSTTQAADEWGVSRSTLQGILSGESAASQPVLSAILEATHLSPVEFYRQHPRFRAAEVEVDRAEDPREASLGRLARALNASQLAGLADRVEALVKLGIFDEFAQVIELGVETAQRAAALAERRGRRRKPPPTDRS